VNFKRKVFLVILGGMAIMVTSILLLSQAAYRMTENFIARKEVLQTFNHARALLAKELDHLRIVNADWSVWDDTFLYMKHRDSEFETANLQDDTFRTLQLSAFSIFDSDDHLVFAYPPGPASLNESTVIAGMRAAAFRDGASAGFVVEDGAFFLVAAHRIMRSDDTGPSLGTLVMSRSADRSTLSDMMSILGSEISLEESDGTESSRMARVVVSGTGGLEAVGSLGSDAPASNINVRVRPETRTILFDKQAFIGFIAIGILIIFVITGLILLLLDRYVIRRMMRISQELEGVAVSGRHDRRVTVDGTDEVSRLGSVLNRTFESLEKSYEEIERGKISLEHSLDERESMFQEIRHRVKNNLQVVASMLSLQADEAEDAALAEAFMNSRRRVIAMAFVHEELYCSDSLNSIALRDYLDHLSALLRVDLDPDSRIGFDSEIADLGLSIEKAIPFALIANEVLSNAFIHAFHDDGWTKYPEKRISLVLRENGEGEYVLHVTDNGCGIGSFPSSKGKLGLTLVSALSSQLNAYSSYKKRTKGGTEYSLTFKPGSQGC